LVSEISWPFLFSVMSLASPQCLILFLGSPFKIELFRSLLRLLLFSLYHLGKLMNQLTYNGIYCKSPLKFKCSEHVRNSDHRKMDRFVAKWFILCQSVFCHSDKYLR
jgi:hypothetical protein